MIYTTDFSDETLEMFNETKKGNLCIFDFIYFLISNDFDKNEVKQFCNKEFGNCTKAVNYAMQLVTGK